MASKDDIARLEQKISDLKEAPAQDKPGENSVLTLWVNRKSQSKFMTCNEDESIIPWTPAHACSLK